MTATRRLLAVVFALLLPATASAADRPVIAAPEAIVVDAQTGDVAFSKAADERRPIASTTKLMTALLTLEHGGLSDVVTAPRYRGAPAEVVLGLTKGEKIKEIDLLRALLIISANDSAVALADHVAGSVPTFVNMMNRRAEQLGLTNTHYANPIGLDDPQNYSSARDLATLTRTLRKYKTFRRIVDTRQTRLRSGNPHGLLINRNSLLDQYDWIDGVKTGHTNTAGNVLVASGSRRNVHLISVVIAATTEAARNEQSAALLKFGFTKYRLSRASVAGRRRTTVPIRNRPGAALPLNEGTTRSKVKRVTEDFTYEQQVPKEVEGPIHFGQRVGWLVVKLRGRKVARVPLVSALEIPKAGSARRTQDFITEPWTLIVLGAILVIAAVLTQRRPAGRRRVGGRESEEPAA